MIKLSTLKTVAFDLDDTLYKEKDFLISGMNYCINEFAPSLDVSKLQLEENWVQIIAKESGANIEEILETYRTHIPDITLSNGALQLLKSLMSKKVRLILITDGRSTTQNNKIDALGIRGFFKQIIISEEIGSNKPDIANFQIDSSNECVYIADNPKKDFITPNALGWLTIQVNDNGRNIHPQDITVKNSQKAKHKVNQLKELVNYV